MDNKFILLELYKDEWNTCRNHQSMRGSMTAMFIAVHTALLAFIFSDNSEGSMLEIAAIGCLLSLFGVLFSKKHHERFSYHLNRARAYKNELDAILPDISLTYITLIADKKTQSKHSLMTSIKLNRLWNIVHWVALFSYVLIIVGDFT